ncbi:tetratricopeptide repeat-containing sulfotransferase family protein [Povalibacter sp.]|uniref:tetratricopeptide repeat-containing sulfotransferase family protein n=1 Tax=Povalibacter sp. TaxID=1962978 RepID=UPI002F423D6E
MSLDPQSLLYSADRLRQAGRWAEAEQTYLQVLARWPHLTDTWYNLGRLQRQMGKFNAALACYQQALDRGVSQPEEVHLNRGVIYSDGLHQYAQAEQELNAALHLNPDYVPALFNLANLNEDFGRSDAALALYQRLLAIDPRHYEALARYAGMRLADGSDDPLIAKLRHALASDDATASDKASLGFALGKMLDACGAYDEAFAAYTAANRHSRTLSPSNSVLYDRSAHERFVDELIATFSKAAPIGASAVAPRPVFICGMFRSGSTLTEQILAAHSQVTPGGELAFLPTLVARQLAPFPHSMNTLGEQQLAELARRYREGLAQLFPGAATVTDKRPDNFLYIGLIKQLFPDAQIVHTTRNALDNCLSIYFLHLDHRMGYALDLEDIAHYYAQYRRLMAHWRTLYGNDILDFEYDTFVREPGDSTRRLLEFCGLEWQDACLSFQQAKTTVRTASMWQVRQQVYRQSSGRWQHYSRHLEPLSAYLRERHLLP